MNYQDLSDRLDAAEDWLFEQPTIIGVGILLLVVFLFLAIIVVPIFLLVGGEGPCGDLQPIREFSHFILQPNGQQIPVYETVGCVR